MSEFYVPYQFVPATAGVKETTPFEKIKKGETNARHDKWVKDALSGRIVCRLTLETPTFVGAKQTRESENKAAFVEPYLRNGKRAIPANSLRGMISSIAETLSQSSLRVLNDHRYSVRKPFNKHSSNDNKRKDVGNNREYFKKISSHLLPLDKNRCVLTPAELLFGVVDEGKCKESEQCRENNFSLASRIRFSDGLLNEKVTFIEEDKPIMLKILGSPKPPCPALYFGQGRYVEKTELNPEKHRPNGRKYYLHHPNSQVKAQFWKVDPTEVEEKTHQMRLQCRPIIQAEFWFHVDFENLSDAELSLLLKSLCPSNEFCHKLGLGKSLGLGSVKIDVMGVFGINRKTRYSSKALGETSRYHWSEQINQEIIAWHNLYKLEYQNSHLKNDDFIFDDFLIDKFALSILNKIGNRSVISKSKSWVHTPLTTRQKPKQEEQVKHSEQYRFESETFKWFGENNRLRTGQQALGHIKENEPLPTLKIIDEHN